MSYKARPLEDGYTAEFDTVDRDEWYRILKEFSDSSIYQTWSYDTVRCGEGNLSHFALRQGGKIVAAAQARILRLPLVGFGAAYVRWGPLWQRRNQTEDPQVLRMAFRALRNEYACRRGLILRIFPVLYGDNSNLFLDMLQKEGYSPSPEKNRSRTLIVALTPPIEELRKRFDQKWRNCLNKAERNNLDVIEGTDDSLFADFISLYRELLQRKKFQEPNDINEFRQIQRDFPDELKMRIFLCRSDGISSAGAIFTAIGDTGVYLFGATNDQGMANKGSYLLQWRAMQWMKNSGCRSYNLNGINPDANPGSYHFKAGVAGKTGKDAYYLGRFDCCSGALNRWLARSADSALPMLKKIISKTRLKTKSQPRPA
jgi:lipid II:glycine glycyltransferase (peptidoglycan interpeptide bridge formation enzyme)